MPLRTKLQIAVTLLAAAGATAYAARLGSTHWSAFFLLLVAILLSSGLKVALPRGDGSMSLNFPFILLGIVQLSPLQAILLAAISVAAQCRIRVNKIFTAVQISFNVANTMLATSCAFVTYNNLRRAGMAPAPALAVASVVYFLWNTVAVAMVLASSKGESAVSLWVKEFPWYLPFYLVGAVLAAVASWMSVQFGWGTALLLVPFVYTLFRAYTGQMSRLKERQEHLEETEALHLRTIEGLAMAIEAKDQNTHDHLFRVRHYVRSVGQALELNKLEMKALETAAFLHDIGKLAVPEHIINKPGKLTPDEFEKMKIHPIVGADILERVRFPYPVVPIVRSHHEWWNGTGYPDGLRETDIPIGARILTVVDCFDALVSDRPYRKGLSGPQALSMIKSLAGRQFDPLVIEAFERCHAAAESSAESLVATAFGALKTEVDVSRGLAPGAGYQAGSDASDAVPAVRQEASSDAKRSGTRDGLSLLATATDQAQAFFELSQSMGDALSTRETLALMASRLRQLVPFDVFTVYLKQGDFLELRFADGDGANGFTGERIPLGEGISGWVAQSGKPILNGNAAVEPGCPLLPNGQPALGSGLSIPLRDLQKDVFAVITVFCVVADSFSRDHLRMLLAMECKLSLSLQNALHRRPAEVDPEADLLTGLPNARTLFLRLGTELARQQDEDEPLSVIVCDMNGLSDVNDRRGHMMGSRLLRSVADAFRPLCTGSEFVARRGGDEFVFVLPGVSEGALKERTELIESALQSAGRRAGHGLRVTASLGTAIRPADGRSAEELLAIAERRMYLEKQRSYSSPTPLSLDLKPTSSIAING